MTAAMMDALRAVAERHRCDVRGVTCMAVAMGPRFWRNAAKVTDYDPKRDGRPHWRTPPQRPTDVPDFDWGLDD